MLVVFEGIDGSGKTTQARMLYRALRRMKYEVTLMREPTDSELGRKIKALLRTRKYTVEELYSLFLADRKSHADTIRRLLERGYIVILDRYYISTIAYQGAQGIPVTRILNDHKDLPKPDIVFLLDIDPEKALSRLNSRDAFENIEFLRRVRKMYLEAGKILSRLGYRIEIIDADRPPREIHQKILRIVLGILAHGGVKNE